MLVKLLIIPSKENKSKLSEVEIEILLFNLLINSEKEIEEWTTSLPSSWIEEEIKLVKFIIPKQIVYEKLIKSAKINLKTPENIFSIKVAFIGNSDILAFTSKEFLDNKSFNIDANSTIEKSAFF